MSVNNFLPVKRGPGRPRKVPGSPPPEKKKKNLLPVLKIDVDRDPELPILAVSDKHQAMHLGWNVAEVRSVNSHLNLYESLPMVCQASGCYYAKQCPTRNEYKFEGKLCPLQTLDIYRWFVGYVTDLEIGPTDFVDLRLVEDLIRIDFQLKMVDQQIQVTGMEVDTVGGVLQMAGKPVWEKGAHPLLLTQDKLRNRRRELHKALIASRDAKMDRDRKAGTIRENELDMFDRIRAMAEKHERASRASVREDNVIDAEVVSEDYEDDED